jgi:hypothetical protein
MTDEMRAAEGLVQALTPTGCIVPIPEPLAIDESRWFVFAADKGLITFSPCHEPVSRGDHFTTGTDDPHHLFAQVDGCHAVLRREYVPAIAAYARAVLDDGYHQDGAVLLAERPTARRLVQRSTPSHVHTHAIFPARDGGVHLQIEAKSDRQLVRRIASSLDAHRRLGALRADLAHELESVTVVRPRFLWLVGPNSIEPAAHVFRVTAAGDDLAFTRVAVLPAPA